MGASPCATNQRELIVNIKNLLDDKGYEFMTVDPESTMEMAVDKMMEHHIGSLVISVDEKPVGIITERDVMHTVYHDHCDIETTKVKDVMSSDIITFDISGTTKDAMHLMFHNETGHRIRHLPIVENEILVGMVSISDLLRRLVQETQFENRIMKNYIQNWPEEEVS